MSRFDGYFRRIGFAALLRWHGRSVIYTPRVGSGGEGVAITMIVGPIDAVPAVGEDGATLGRTRGGELALSDVAKPSARDRVSIDDEEWIVHEVLSMQAGKAALRLLRPERTEIGQRNYRRP